MGEYAKASRKYLTKNVERFVGGQYVLVMAAIGESPGQEVGQHHFIHGTSDMVSRVEPLLRAILVGGGGTPAAPQDGAPIGQAPPEDDLSM